MILNFDPPIAVVRELFAEYAAQLGIDLCFQNFQNELLNLPDRYQSLIVAYDRELPAGCVGLRPFAPTVAEMKRLYVRAGYRGSGLGRRLAQAAINQARVLGFRAIRLDTLPVMKEAIPLYRSLAFHEVSGPSANLLYFELDL